MAHKSSTMAATAASSSSSTSTALPTSSSHLLQGFSARKNTGGEPKNAAQYFNHVANLVEANRRITCQRKYNLKRRYQVHYHGYEAVLNRKKRYELSRAESMASSTALLQTVVAASPTASKATLLAKTPSSQTSATPSPLRQVAPQQVQVPTQTHAQLQAQATTKEQVQAPAQPNVSVQQQHLASKRSDFTMGCQVMIRHSLDLVACGGAHLVGKTGKIVAMPQMFGHDIFSVFIDDLQSIFHVPINSLTNLSLAVATAAAAAAAASSQRITAAQLGIISSSSSASSAVNTIVSSGVSTTVAASPATALTANTPTRSASVEEVKAEHAFQLHRLMQQQYREIQVLQQQYAECRIVNPAALPEIQQELSKLRLVHLSQVQTLKSKQALDLLGR